MGYQLRADLIQAQLDAVGVWKGNGGVIASWFLADARVDDEGGFQKGTTAERIQYGLWGPGNAISSRARCVKFWAVSRSTGMGTGKEEFAKRWEVLPNFMCSLVFSSPCRNDIGRNEVDLLSVIRSGILLR